MRKVEATVCIHTTPEKAISAFTNPVMLQEWWGVEQTLIELKTGGVYTLAWQISDKGFGFVSSGSIKEHQPDKLFAVENMVYMNPEKPFLGPMSFTVTAKPKGDTTEVYICQEGYQTGEVWDWYYQAVKDAWPAALLTLKAYLEKEFALAGS